MKLEPGEKAILPVWFRAGLVLSLILTLYYSITHRQADQLAHQSLSVDEQVTMQASRNLHFFDLDNGVVSVVDADDGGEIIQLIKGEGGFMRSVMRGLVRERKAQGQGAETPFQLALWEDGLVSLIDPATGRRVELSAFGIDNVRAFTRLLPAS
jgi:putative photosynthetic complex assembly protein